MRQFRWIGSDWQWCALVCATFILLLLINPLGYIGGGWDDWQYLEASRCWVDHGPCLPRTHWEGRWPVFAPIAAFVGVFGESRTTVGLWPLAASIAAIALLVLVGNRLVGRPVGWVAGLLLLVTPAFSIQILDPSVEAIELSFILGGVFCILVWLKRRSAWLALLAGLSFGLAFQVRETSLIAVVLTGLFVMTRRPRAIDIAAALAGFLSPLAIELITFGMATGDPLFRRHLSLTHAQVPSSELPGAVDRSQPPFFNKEFIANWRHEPGMHLHWAIDGLLNLFINGKAGMSLVFVPLLALADRKRITRVERGQLTGLYGLGILYAAVLIYVLAVDPKARIMFPTLSAACLALAVILSGFKNSNLKLLLIAACVMHALIGVIFLFGHQRIDIAEKQARRWIVSLTGQIEMDSNTRRHLALVKEASSVPDLSSDREYLVLKSGLACDQWARKAGLPTHAIDVIDRAPLSLLDRIAFWNGGELCLFRYNQSVRADRLRAAIIRSRPNITNFVVPNNSSHSEHE